MNLNDLTFISLSYTSFKYHQISRMESANEIFIKYYEDVYTQQYCRKIDSAYVI